MLVFVPNCVTEEAPLSRYYNLFYNYFAHSRMRVALLQPQKAVPRSSERTAGYSRGS